MSGSGIDLRGGRDDRGLGHGSILENPELDTYRNAQKCHF